MPNLFVRQKVEQSTTSVTSFTTSAMTVTAGDALVVATSANGIPAITISDSKGDVFATEVSFPSYSGIVQWDFSSSAVGGSTTFTVTADASWFLSIAVQEYSGVASAPLEGNAQDFGSSQIPNPGPLNPASVGDLYLSAWSHDGSGNETFTPGPGWTLRANLTNTANAPLGTEEFIGSGSQVGKATLSGSATPRWICVAMALRAADVAAPDDGASPNYIAADFPAASRGFGDPG